MKISTTITKKFFDLKMQDLEKFGYFFEFKEDKPFWKKRLDKFEDAGSAEIIFLVGNKLHRFDVCDIIHIHRSQIPERYRSAISTDFAYAISCQEIYPQEEIKKTIKISEAALVSHGY